MAETSAGDLAARELTQRYAERAMRAVVALARSGKSARVRVSAAKTVLRGESTMAEKKVAIEALVEVMDAAKSEAAQLSAAKEILRVSHVQPATASASGDRHRGDRDRAREREPLPLPPALATLLARTPPGRAGKRWQHGTALASGTVQPPR